LTNWEAPVMRLAPRNGALPSEFTYGNTTERHFDYLLKKMIKS